jgi:endonuclease I
MRRSAPFIAAVGLVLAVVTVPAQSSVLISELCDPHLNYTTDRFIEVYNAGVDPVDLTGWSLVAVGNNTDIFTWDLSGHIDPGQALVAGDATTTIEFPVDFPDEAWSSNNGLWNGKIGDGAKLLDGDTTIIDYAVVDGTRFENKDYVRNYGVIEPNTIYDPSEWTATPVELPTDGSPGTHDTELPPPGPAITYVRTVPEAPLAGEEVDVLADVADTVATVTSVWLSWGTSPFSLVNDISMSLVSGETYQTDETIPSHSVGVTVYYEVHAENDLPATGTSDLQSYSLPYTLSIHDIQGEVSVSPYDGFAAITHGVVTGVYGSYFVVQDGSGPWNGIWANGEVAPSVGDSVTVRGHVTEDYGSGNDGNTLIAEAVVTSVVPGAELPEAVVVTTAGVWSEGYEGVLARIEDAECTSVNEGYGVWRIDDGSGFARVGDLGYDASPTLGTTYDVVGPVTYSFGSFKPEPRGPGDVLWVGDTSAPVIFHTVTTSDTTVLVTFTEDVDAITAEVNGNYTIESLTISAAQLEPGHPDQVALSVSAMDAGTYTLAVDGVEDLFGNVVVGVVDDFDHLDLTVPPGYYDSAEGLIGQELRAALHEIIDSHVVWSYDYVWTAFRTSDDRSNGFVWDIYSDVPGGTPPYEYTFGVDQGGIGGEEGNGYSREHSWPRSWFGGEVSPMNSDLFALYPVDAHVNGNRGSNPYGEVAAPDWVSLNGSRSGPCSYPGYSGIVFEPIDAYKGDLARSYFYMSTRYYSEDAAWPGSPMTDGAELLPWAVDMLLQWHADDVVDQKEIERNGTVYALQHNRNPFIDRPEFASLIFSDTGIEDTTTARLSLFQNVPNPFNPATAIEFQLPHAGEVRLLVYDVVGRHVRTLVSESRAAGRHRVTWDGRDATGRPVASGVYFSRLETGKTAVERKMVLLK